MPNRGLWPTARFATNIVGLILLLLATGWTLRSQRSAGRSNVQQRTEKLLRLIAVQNKSHNDGQIHASRSTKVAIIDAACSKIGAQLVSSNNKRYSAASTGIIHTPSISLASCGRTYGGSGSLNLPKLVDEVHQFVGPLSRIAQNTWGVHQSVGLIDVGVGPKSFAYHMLTPEGYHKLWGEVDVESPQKLKWSAGAIRTTTREKSECTNLHGERIVMLGFAPPLRSENLSPSLINVTGIAPSARVLSLRFAEDLYILTRTGQKRDYNLYFGQIAKSLTFIVSNLERLNITAVQLSAIDGFFDQNTTRYSPSLYPNVGIVNRQLGYLQDMGVLVSARSGTMHAMH